MKETKYIDRNQEGEQQSVDRQMCHDNADARRLHHVIHFYEILSVTIVDSWMRRYEHRRVVGYIRTL